MLLISEYLRRSKFAIDIKGSADTKERKMLSDTNHPVIKENKVSFFSVLAVTLQNTLNFSGCRVIKNKTFPCRNILIGVMDSS